MIPPLGASNIFSVEDLNFISLNSWTEGVLRLINPTTARKTAGSSFLPDPVCLLRLFLTIYSLTSLPHYLFPINWSRLGVAFCSPCDPFSSVRTSLHT